MNSSAATFWVQDTGYSVRSLTQHAHQATVDNGTVTARPISGELSLVLDVRPRDLLLPTWAYSPHLALPARVVFDALDGVSTSLTLTLEEAYCVGYEEHFEHTPAAGQPSFYCLVRVVARQLLKQGVAYTNAWPEKGQ